MGDKQWLGVDRCWAIRVTEGVVIQTDFLSQGKQQVICLHSKNKEQRMNKL